MQTNINDVTQAVAIIRPYLSAVQLSAMGDACRGEGGAPGSSNALSTCNARSKGARSMSRETCSAQETQFSTFSPFTRLNSFSLFVTSVALSARACAAISMSYAPMISPRRSSVVRNCP